MKTIIEGRIYDTDTATHMCSSAGQTQDMHDYPHHLYRSPRGQFFVFHDSDYGREIELIDEDDARSFFEHHGNPAEYQDVFGKRRRSADPIR
jgi:hypothetical protein